MREYFDDLETRSEDERANSVAESLPKMVAKAKRSPFYFERFSEVIPESIQTVEDLTKLPILRKSEISKVQKDNPPFGGLELGKITDFNWIFQSPGPIYEPGMAKGDWWRLGRFLHACRFGNTDIVLNCMSHHLTPAGAMFESGARVVGATVLPGGPGQTELQVRAASASGVTAYAGTPDFLKVILDKAADLGLSLPNLKKAAVSGGALFPSLRKEYASHGITCLQVYATAELGNIAYESNPDSGLIVDEGVIVEIVTPGTSDPVAKGRTGEVVVTLLSGDYPLIRLATGDLSSVMEGKSPCGRTNIRLAGWKGRADQTAKVKGMFVRPEQVAELTRRHPSVHRTRIVITRKGEMDEMTILIESESADLAEIEVSATELLKVRGRVKLQPPNTLPDDGKVIDDQRNYD